jgi:hypothetical protein
MSRTPPKNKRLNAWYLQRPSLTTCTLDGNRKTLKVAKKTKAKRKPDIMANMQFSIGNVSQVAGWAAIL